MDQYIAPNSPFVVVDTTSPYNGKRLGGIHSGYPDADGGEKIIPADAEGPEVK